MKLYANFTILVTGLFYFVFNNCDYLSIEPYRGDILLDKQNTAVAWLELKK